MKLADLKTGESGIIIKVRGRGAFRKRIMEMGFVQGKTICVIKNAPLRDPVEYKIMDYNISLRRSEAEMIEIEKLGRAVCSQNFNGTIQGAGTRRRINKKSRTIHVALVGNPNCGKTTLFNFVSGLRERVGNYGGVTIDVKEGTYTQNGYTFTIADLPGTYSLSAYSGEELFVRDYIIDAMPDVVINIIDASNLERNLYLTSQLIDMDIKVVIALNLYDELGKKGDRFEHTLLGDMLGIPIVPTISVNGSGIQELFDAVIQVYEDRSRTSRHIHINYGKDLERSIAAIQNAINKKENVPLTDRISSRFIAVKLLEHDKAVQETIFTGAANPVDILSASKIESERLHAISGEDSETQIVNAKYGFISGALRETYTQSRRPARTLSEQIDSVLTHRYIGFPLFFFFMWFMFQMTFFIGKFPVEWLSSFIKFLSDVISLRLSEGIARDMIIDGVIAGTGGVLVFLPNILILFFMISIMEDTGYMARASFIMDRLMHKIGLHGKSCIPLLMGFGCNVPAIMATRTLENRNDRLLTMLIIPFMSCSARLPVYVLLIGAFLPWSSGSMLFGIYLCGIAIAVLTALILKRTVFKEQGLPFVMELPPYRIPNIKSGLLHMWDKGSQYIKKIAGIVLIASVIIWAMGRFPLTVSFSKNYPALIEQTRSHYRLHRESGSDAAENDRLRKGMQREIRALERQQQRERIERSYIGQIGAFIQPVIAPLGFDWKMGVSLISGFAAKEVVVSTMGILYAGSGAAINDHQGLGATLREQRIFSPLSAFAFMIFVLTYFPCMASIATIRRESGSWKWAAFAAIYTTAVAWLLALGIYQIGSLIL